MINGVLNINKPKGYTSHDIVNIVRKHFNTKKVGHTGTLDPNATGVLPLCLGKATKLSSFIMGSDKIYRAVLILGISTDTQDITGKILNELSVNLTKKEIEDVINSFVGEIEQIPPMYSAIKIGGKKLYELARKNIEIERQPRKVIIHNIKILKFLKSNEIEIEVHCTSGTYIRTLCNDIGEKLKCGATMGDLIRIKSSIFTIENSIEISKLENLTKEALIMPNDIFENYKNLIVKDNFYNFLKNGNALYPYQIKDIPYLENGEIVKIFSMCNTFFGLYKWESEMLKVLVYIGA
ncbi:MAG: tRNA pseudouridine(55) synthase TruB [Defluviitaleaceae bacterium]|nr:tRNA pseudouridine(55) synthase TruB [Defluviitaleaceae bacterium]